MTLASRLISTFIDRNMTLYLVGVANCRLPHSTATMWCGVVWLPQSTCGLVTVVWSGWCSKPTTHSGPWVVWNRTYVYS